MQAYAAKSGNNLDTIRNQFNDLWTATQEALPEEDVDEDEEDTSDAESYDMNPLNDDLD